MTPIDPAAIEAELNETEELLLSLSASNSLYGKLIATCRTLLAELDTVQRWTRNSCPCCYTTPCHPNCTCVNPSMSTGCNRCCRYGSTGQRKAQAERIVAELARARAAVEVAEAYLDFGSSHPMRPDFIVHFNTSNQRLTDALAKYRAAKAKEPT